MSDYLHGIEINVKTTGAPGMKPIRTAIIGVVGTAKRGDNNKPILLDSFKKAKDIFTYDLKKIESDLVQVEKDLAEITEKLKTANEADKVALKSAKDVFEKQKKELSKQKTEADKEGSESSKRGVTPVFSQNRTYGSVYGSSC